MPRFALVTIALVAAAGSLGAQVQGKFPPDSLVNTKVFPHNTPVTEVIGAMRNFSGALGVRCQFCHVGEEGKPLETFDFAKDEKRTKLVARQMMRMVQEINRRLDTLPERQANGLQVTCATCHRGLNKPVPLATVVSDAGMSFGADSAIRAYKALREKYYGRDAYDFSEMSLNNAALRLTRANKVDDALALLKLNEEQYPKSSSTYVARGNVYLIKGDTTSAAGAFREAIKRDPMNREAMGRLRDIGQKP
jgi:hypothetical protein